MDFQPDTGPVVVVGAPISPECATELPAVKSGGRTLRDLVLALGDDDNALADPNFDPETFLQEIRDKVDNVKFVVDRMESTAQWLKDFAKPFFNKASTILNNRLRLRAYVVDCLLIERANRADPEAKSSDISIPGEAFKVRLRDSNPELQVDREPTAEDYERWPHLVRMNRSYSWINAAIKDALKAGVDLDGLPARLTISHWPEFVINVPEQLEPKKRSKKK